MISSSANSKLEFLKSPTDSVLVTKFGNLQNPTEKILTMRKIKTRKDMLEQV
jgi:hypothetical protein